MNVLVTGGGTVAPIDDVRHLTNVSTGRFSAEISEACLRRGASVWHVHSPTAQLPFCRLAGFDLDQPDPEREIERLLKVRREYAAVRDRLHLCPVADGTVANYAATLERVFREVSIEIAFLAMAVSDYEPIPFEGKLRSDLEFQELRLRATPKIIRTIRKRLPDVYLVGFKLQSGSTVEELVAVARESGLVNQADLTVANDLQLKQKGQHTIHLIPKDGPVETLGPGGDIADGLVERVLAWSLESRRIERAK